MNSNSEWPSVTRVVWIAGGIVAFNEPGNDVQIYVGMGGRNLCTLHIRTYASLFEVLREKGFPILGATFLMHPEEFQGLRPPEFRAMSPSKGWLVWELTQKWRQIAFAAGKDGRMPLMDVASRIASGLRYSQMRLHDLVKAYSIQLCGHLHKSEAKEYQAFKDTNSFEVYKAIHALFWEIAVLRDTLAEFAAVFCLSQVGVKTMAGLRRSLGKNPPCDPLADEILRSTDQLSSGWLATFTSYRNFFTHVAPIEQAANISLAVQDMRDLSGGFSVPQIYYALPPDIEDLTRRRSKGIFFNSLEELSAASSRRHQRSSEPDALDYFHGCINQFAELALTLVARSPILPKPIHIGPGDIIGGIKVT
jgi:hypothetical protein